MGAQTTDSTDVIAGFRDPYHMPDTPLAGKIDYLRRYAAGRTTART